MNNRDEIFRVDGMTCGGCEASVKRALGALDGVTEVEADHAAHRVTVKVREDGPARIKLARAIEDAGFDVVEA